MCNRGAERLRCGALPAPARAVRVVRRAWDSRGPRRQGPGRRAQRTATRARARAERRGPAAPAAAQPAGARALREVRFHARFLRFTAPRVHIRRRGRHRQYIYCCNAELIFPPQFAVTFDTGSLGTRGVCCGCGRSLSRFLRTWTEKAVFADALLGQSAVAGHASPVVPSGGPWATPSRL